MANIDAKLQVAELDFDTIKRNLKEFMQAQSEFSDYNFEGSGLSTLLDVLAYNTHYMGYYLNMVANEMFIDTALTRGAVVSHAKLLGYTPRSRVAAKAAVDLTITPVANDSNSSIVIPRFTRFISETKDGTNYIFVTPSARIVSKNTTTGLFNVENLEIKEGQPVTFSYTYNSQTNPNQVFELQDSGIDTSTLFVAVQKSTQNANLETFVLAQDATDVDETAAVYYLEENKNGRYQIYFGDDVIGKKLSDGNIVIVSYVVTSGLSANGLKSFRLLDSILTNTTTTVTLRSESSAGALAETIDQIKFTAPKSYIAQNRVKNNVIKPFSVLTVTPEYVAADYNYLNLSVDVNFDPTKTNKTAEEVKTTIVTAVRNFANTSLDTFNNSFKVSQLSRVIDDSENSITSNDVKVIIEKRFAPDTTRSQSYSINFGTELQQGTTLQRLTSTPSFTYVDSANVERECFIEEVLQSYTGVEEIEVTAPGSGFTTTPSVIIEGDGTGAIAQALVVNGSIRKIQIVNAGTGYTSATARIDGGGGTGAVLRPILQGRYGQLKIFTIVNSIKKTVVENIGTINYKTGLVTLNNFFPTAVSDPFGTLVIKATPTKKIFSSERNRIITLDLSDPTALSVTVNAIIE